MRIPSISIVVPVSFIVAMIAVLGVTWSAGLYGKIPGRAPVEEVESVLSESDPTSTPDPFDNLTLDEFEASQLMPFCIGSDVVIEHLVIRRMNVDDFFDLSYSSFTAADMPADRDVWVMAFITSSPFDADRVSPSSYDPLNELTSHLSVTATAPSPGAIPTPHSTPTSTPVSPWSDTNGRTTAYCAFWESTDRLLMRGILEPTNSFWTIQDLETLPRW